MRQPLVMNGAAPDTVPAATAARAPARSRLLAIAVPAPQLDLGLARAVLGRELAVLWEPPQGAAWVTAGAAARLDLVGPDRFATLAAEAKALFARLGVRAPAGAPAPRLFGGLAFAPGAAAAPEWAGFGDGSFVLPRLAYVKEGAQAWLLAIGGADDPGLGAELDDTLGRLSRGHHLAALPSPAPPAVRLAPEGDAGWHTLVRGIVAEIERGAVEKIVAARRQTVVASGSFDEGAVLGRLAGQPGTWRFAFGRGPSTFLGATPERLVARAGTHVASDALAGSVAPGRGAALVASAKEQREHGFVVQAISAALAPFCRDLTVPATPRVRELRHLLHLWTPIHGELTDPRTHVVALAEALHPTPAVAGTPAATALAWIAAHEPAPRGWYAGPVGWCDGNGDGELVVALRSALLSGERAFVPVGAGIVAGSDPERELAETELKLVGTLRALGVTAEERPPKAPGS
jgi:isochorismate synthase